MKHDETNSDMNGGLPVLPEDLEARTVAWVAGEASAFEIAELERIASERKDVAEFKRAMELVHRLATDAERADAEPLRMGAERRSKLLQAIGGGIEESEHGAAARSPQSADKTHEKLAVLPSQGKRRFVWLRQPWMSAAAACVVVGFVAVSVFQPGFKAARPNPDETVLRQTMTAGAGAAVAGSTDLRRGAGAVKAAAAEPADVAMPIPQDAPSILNFSKIEVQPSEERPSGPTVFAGMSLRESDALNLGKSTIGGSLAVAGDKTVNETWAGSRTFVSGAPTPAPASPSQSVDFFSPTQEARVAGLGGSSPTSVTFGQDTRQAGSIFQDSASQAMPSGSAFRTVTLSAFAATGGKQPSNQLNDSNLEVIDTGLGIANSASTAVSSRIDLDSVAAPKADALAKNEISGSFRDEAKMKASLQEGLAVSGAIRSFVATDTQLKDAEKKPAETESLKRVDGLRGAIDAKSAATPPPTQVARANRVEKGRVLNLGVLPSPVSGGEHAKESLDDRPLVRAPIAPVPTAPEISAAKDPFSTFSLHVSDVSFKLAHAALLRGEMPDAARIRPEEFYNAFNYGDAAPTVAEKIGAHIEQAAHPFLQSRNLVRIAMKVPATGRGSGTPLRLTVLLDTSGSMEREDRVASVRRAMEVLVSLLGPSDRITLIGFARQPRLLAEALPGDQAKQLLDIMARIPADGGTNLEEALKLGTELARRHQLRGAQNRVVLLTDGAANLGDAEPARLAASVDALRQQGIAFDACGVGLDGLDDAILEALTRKGDGRYYVLNSPDAADAGFARQLAGALRPAAENVKLQVRFNPARVGNYRLIGFEQHRLNKEDFRNDKVDAAELAAEEAAVALYQVEVLPQGTGEIGEVFVRFRDAASGEMVERSWNIGFEAGAPAFDRATPTLQLAGTAALLAERLRGGEPAASIKLRDLTGIVNALRGHFAREQRVQELVAMFGQMRRMGME